MFKPSSACSLVLKRTLNVDKVASQNTLQTLWSGYGEIIRCHLAGGQLDSLIVKHVKVPDSIAHPRGWNTDVSHQRKMHSYSVEANWYDVWSTRCDDHCRVPRCYHVESSDNEFLLLLEDLDLSGFPVRIEQASLSNMRLCLKWLAYFHANFMGEKPESESSLWQVGTYWHLATRSDELAALEDESLRQAAISIDEKLRSSEFQTIIHGDAKLANFCFSENESRVAAVDFQYVGGGCGIKDVMLFLSSCLKAEGLVKHEAELLDYYFSQLKKALNVYKPVINSESVEKEWRSLYCFAWADFVRFLKGWSPGHWKVHAYSEKMTMNALALIDKI